MVSFLMIWIMEYGYEYAIAHRKNYNDWELREILKALSPKRGEKILDIGCGTGEFCYIMKADYGISPIGIDINEKAVEIAGRTYPDIDFRNISVEEIGGRDYDAVVMIEVIEHLKDPFHILCKIREMLKSDGRVMVSTPNRWAFIHNLKSAITGSNYLNDPLHIQEFNPKSLTSLFVRAGFIVSNIYTKPLGVPLIRHINNDLYYNIKSGMFGTYIFLSAHWSGL